MKSTNECFISKFLRRIEREDNQRIASHKSVPIIKESKPKEEDISAKDIYIYVNGASFRYGSGVGGSMILPPNDEFWIKDKAKADEDYTCYRTANNACFLIEISFFNKALTAGEIKLK